MARVGWRWVAVAAVSGVLASLPQLVGALPAGSTDLTAEQLRDRVRASSAVGWAGYGESRAGLALPDVRDLGELPGLLGDTTRTRIWWRGPGDWRVDQLLLAGEVDVVRRDEQTVTWTSADRRADVLFGELPVRLPRAADLVAPMLGRRFAATPDSVLSRLPERRVAGRTTAGLRVAPADPASTTVASVDMWVEPGSGLPLFVEVYAQGQQGRREEQPALTSVLLDLDLGRPPAARTAFEIPNDADATLDEAPDVAAAIDRFAPYRLPERLAGAGRQDPAALGTTGVGTYGAGFGAYAVIPLPGDVGARVARVADDDGLIGTPLVNAVVGGQGRRSYLVVGTVPAQVLQQALQALRDDPPPRVRP